MHRYSITWVPPQYLFQRGLDPAQFLKELAGLGTVTHVTLDAGRLPALAELNPELCYLGWTLDLETAKDLKVIEAVFDFVREDSTLTIVDNPVEAHAAAACPKRGEAIG
jgi:two-component system chemotaxis sensor kinase CheA